MYIYDRVNLLAQDIKESREFREYKTAKDALAEDETAKQLVKQYKKLQFEAQAMVMSGRTPDNDSMQQLQKLGELLSFNPKAAAYFEAEYKFNTVISDLYKIIGQAAEIDMDFMVE